MGKFKLLRVEQFLDKKIIYGQKKDPVWTYLEKEMLQNIGKKPYNEKVGNWLRFLKDLKYHYHCEAKRKLQRLQREAGPAWYVELSRSQIRVLEELKANIHQDLLEDLPCRIRQSLSDLGLTLKLSKKTLIDAMLESVEDPGVFIWTLYQRVYKMSPTVLRKEYDMNARILMSCLVIIDMEECKRHLKNLTFSKKPPPPPPKEKKKRNTQPKVKYGVYLQKTYIPSVITKPPKEKDSEPLPREYKFRLRSEESHERLINNTSFLEKRKERNKKEKQCVRVCNYKFWEAPISLRNNDPNLVAYVNKLRMLKLRARVRFEAPFDSNKYHIGGVCFVGGKPRYILNTLLVLSIEANKASNLDYDTVIREFSKAKTEKCFCNYVALLPTGYIPIHGGIINMYQKEPVICILGSWKYPKDVIEKCDTTCDCLTKWETTVMDYLDKSKCKCGHLYDYYNEGPQPKEKYFYPTTRHGPFWLDKAKIFQMDPMEDFIKDTFERALKSQDATPEPSSPKVSVDALKPSELLESLLADLSDTPLLIPHLPQANLLTNLQKWTSAQVKGKITPKEHKQLLLQSQRRWLDLKHMDFRAPAYRIPFTLKQLQNINWSHRKLVQTLFANLMEDFVTRNRLKQLEQTRLWWSTMKHDIYPNEKFLDIFFTYMPSRPKDIHLINPFSSELIRKGGAKTCPLVD